MAGILDQTGIENFYDVASQSDFARKNLFRVVQLGGQNFNLGELMYITTATLPGRTITNVPVPFMGLTFNVPGTVTYPGSDAWAVVLRIPQNLSIRNKLESWSRYVFDDQTSTGAYNIPDKSIANQTILTLIDKQGNPLNTYTLYGCYCKEIGTFELDVTNAGTELTTTATLAYQYWRLT